MTVDCKKQGVSIMKKWIAVLLCAALCAFLPMGNGVYAQKTDAEHYAALLHNIKLFYGNENDYGLSSVATRAESVAMVLRIRGDEKAALSENCDQPFCDVPDWAKNYVGYAYQNNIASGIDATRFGSDNAVTANQYVTFILRALGYSDSDGDFSWDQAISFSKKISLISSDLARELSAGEFTRDKMVTLSYLALSQPLKNSKATLSSVLIEKGAAAEGAVRSVGVQVVFDGDNTPTDSPSQDEDVSVDKAGKVVNTGSKNLMVRATPGGDQVGCYAPGAALSVLRQRGSYYYVSGTDALTGRSVMGYCAAAYIELVEKQPEPPVQVSGTLAEKIEALMQKYPDGSYWNHVGGLNNADGVTSLPCTHHGTGTCGYFADNCDCNSFNNAIQCLGFAYKIGQDLFGTNVRNWKKFYTYDDLRPGDHVRYIDGSCEHSLIVLSKTSEGVMAADCNYDGKCGIRWYAFVSRDKVEGKMLYYQTGQ